MIEYETCCSSEARAEEFTNYKNAGKYFWISFDIRRRLSVL